MFRIINMTTSRELGLTDTVNYIKISKNSGCYISAKKEEAIGVAYRGTPYNLEGKSEIKDADTVRVYPADGGMLIGTLTDKEEALAKQLAETDEAAIQLYEANIALNEANAEQDEAIIEIYEMMGEITNG